MPIEVRMEAHPILSAASTLPQHYYFWSHHFFHERRLMSKFLTITFVHAASYASILGLYLTLVPLDHPRPHWHWILLGASVLAAIGLILKDFLEYRRFAPKTYTSQKKIDSYMCKWVSSGGRVAIFSRDMSWARVDPIRAILRKKAERSELIVCLEHAIELTDELQSLGAQIITYQDLNHIPRSRFTIVDYGREGARVAVGVHENKGHVIQEFRSGHHPFFAVAEDLVKFLDALKASKNVS
jgi:hypothetical protein